MMIRDPKSPCVGVCRVDEQRCCTTCHRSEEEIFGWGRFSEEQKDAVLERLQALGESAAEAG